MATTTTFLATVIGSLFLFTFVFGLPCGLLCASLANNKGYSAWRWFAGGVLFNILGLIAAKPPAALNKLGISPVLIA